MLIGLAVTTIGKAQTCVLSPDTTGGPGYNQPQPYVKTHYTYSVPVAWPQGVEGEWVEFSGTYDGYSTSWPSDFQTALDTSYSNWNGDLDANNSDVGFTYYGTSDDGLYDVDNVGNPTFQPWHEWTAVNQSDLGDEDTLADTESEFENYGSDSEPYYAIGTAQTRASNEMSSDGDSQSWEANTFAHETGHTFALLDCEDCDGAAGGTIMSYQASGPYSSDNITGPQYCDNQQTQQTAYPY